MQYDISGHHLSISDGLRFAIRNRFGKLATHFPDLDYLRAHLRVEKHGQHIEVATRYLGNRIAVHASHRDMYVAIGNASRKLKAALQHRRGAQSAFERTRGIANPSDAPEET